MSAEAARAHPRTLPDLLGAGQRLVFVGINPGEESARRGHYYAHPGNGFWPALSASGLVSRPVGPEEDRWVASHCGIGFTDVVKRVVTDSSAVRNRELREAAPALARRLVYAGPQAVCFTSARAFDCVFPGLRGHGDNPEWGRQQATIAGADVWVMPSTSGRAVAYRAHVQRVLRDLAHALSAPETWLWPEQGP